MGWPEFVQSIDTKTYVTVLAFLAVGIWYVTWRVARKMVRWGYAIFYFLVGFLMLVLVLPLFGYGSGNLWPAAIGGAVFSTAIMSIRSRIFRFLTAGCALGVAHFAGGLWEAATGHGPGPETIAQFTHIKARFPSAAKPLSRKGPLPKGWLSEKPYATLGFAKEISDLNGGNEGHLHRFLRNDHYDVWCPGGAVTTAAKGLELKLRS